MKWNHLPTDGGIYGQHPKFLDDLLIIASEENKADRERAAREKRRKR